MSIKFPKLDWSSKAEELENAPPELSEEVYKVLKSRRIRECSTRIIRRSIQGFKRRFRCNNKEKIHKPS